MYLTQIEMEMMQVFWSMDKPLSLSELIAASPERTWKDRSGFSIINSLIKKGFLKEEGYTHSGKTIARTFVPVIGYTEYISDQISESKAKMKIADLFASILGNEAIDAQAIKELDKLIEKKKKELGE